MQNLVIFGDSYSTYEGHIPEGYRTYYSKNGREEGPAVTKMKLEETWWKRLLAKTEMRLLLNNSWSGSTIGYTGYDNADCSASNSFIYRFRQLVKQGFFTNNLIDTFLIFGGTNDSWSNAPLGEMKLSDWEEKDLYFVLPAVCHFMSEVKKHLPNAKIYFIINTNLKPEINDCIKQASLHYGIKTIELKDIEKDCGHPTPNGMKAICEQVFENL